jgi:putative YphP/YqiW family bacilliredoxin
MYPKELTAPMAQELEIKGFQSLTNASQVDQALDNASGTTLLMINSVCGCAAAAARPGVVLSLENDKNPTQLVTVFAGVDTEAVQKAREYLLPYPPSSPCIALLKDGKIVHFLERHHIEGRSAQMIADNLQQAYNVFC